MKKYICLPSKYHTETLANPAVRTSVLSQLYLDKLQWKPSWYYEEDEAKPDHHIYLTGSLGYFSDVWKSSTWWLTLRSPWTHSRPMTRRPANSGLRSLLSTVDATEVRLPVGYCRKMKHHESLRSGVCFKSSLTRNYLSPRERKTYLVKLQSSRELGFT